MTPGGLRDRGSLWSEGTGRGGSACERRDELKVKGKSINTQMKVKSSSPFLVHRSDNIFLNGSVLSPLLPVLVFPNPKCARPTAGISTHVPESMLAVHALGQAWVCAVSGSA